MISLVLVAAIASAAIGISDLEPEDCSSSQLDVCVEQLPGPKQFGIPRNQRELDNHCRKYHAGMGCMDAWVARCMPGDHQRVVNSKIAGARSLMFLMCNSTAFQKEYIREQSCWPAVSTHLSNCIDHLHEGASQIVAGTPSDVNRQLCCVQGDFDQCVWAAGRARCNASAARLLRRMTRILASDVGSCPQVVFCAGANVTTCVLLIIIVAVINFL